MKQAVSSLIILLLLSACGGRRSTPASMRAGEYVHFVESQDGFLSTTIKSGIWNYRFQYKPAAYTALKEQEPGHINPAVVTKRVVTLSRTVWFNVGISVAGAADDPLKYQSKDLNEYNARLSYFLTQASRNFHLTYGRRGEMQQIGYVLENNYNIKPELTIVVGFRIPDASPKESITLEYYDGLFNAGILKFNIPPARLTALPQPII